jgi:hypothetical protein
LWKSGQGSDPVPPVYSVQFSMLSPWTGPNSRVLLVTLLTEGPACEMDGADVLLPPLEAKTVIADKGFDAEKQVLDP